MLSSLDDSYFYIAVSPQHAVDPSGPSSSSLDVPMSDNEVDGEYSEDDEIDGEYSEDDEERASGYETFSIRNGRVYSSAAVPSPTATPDINGSTGKPNAGQARFPPTPEDLHALRVNYTRKYVAIMTQDVPEEFMARPHANRFYLSLYPSISQQRKLGFSPPRRSSNDERKAALEKDDWIEPGSVTKASVVCRGCKQVVGPAFKNLRRGYYWGDAWVRHRATCARYTRCGVCSMEYVYPDL
ncbi:hypothetical protein BDZ89DRAFT_1125691 [Hymenopellis radicata]|nr:hypothetical protein BDZ89DRAFT_1125691 [Hymenopellis radicata]